VWALDAGATVDLRVCRQRQQYQVSHSIEKERFVRREMNGSIVSTLSERPVGGRQLPGNRNSNRFELKSLILAQIERWRHALHMQVERQRGSNPGGEWRTGE
jgi:hypothetical protein